MTPNNRSILGAVALVCALGFASAAEATLVRVIPFDKKVEEAQSIVIGKCVQTRSEWDPTHRWILTYSTFAVEQPLKGNPASEVTVVTPGGQVGSIHQDSIGVPAFNEGDERVLFIRDTKSGPTVLYYDQGAYEVRSDDRGGKEIVPVPTGAVQVDTQTGKAAEPEHARSLRDFQGEIQSSIERVKSQRMEMIRDAQRRQALANESPLSKYRYLLMLAAVGAALATWHLLRRS